MSMPRKILIVEDCADVLGILGEALTLFGWETILTANGQDVLNKLEYNLPNVVFLSLRTPLRDGTKLAASIKAQPAFKDIPILAASRHSFGLSRERCRKLGFDDFIAKPFALPELEMRLTNILSRERRKTIREQQTLESEI